MKEPNEIQPQIIDSLFERISVVIENTRKKIVSIEAKYLLNMRSDDIL